MFPILNRLESNDGDGAWCPAGPVYPNNDEYLQIDLRRLYFLTLVGTQGRDGGGLGKEFVRHYQLRYSRDGYKWAHWQDRWGNEVRLFIIRDAKAYILYFQKFWYACT